MYTSLYALQGDTESLFEYMGALASHELNPMIIPPDMLKNIPTLKLKRILSHMLDLNSVKTQKQIYGLITEQ